MCVELVNVVSIAGLAAAAVSWFAIAIPFVIIVAVVIQRFYVKTSKQLRLLELVPPHTQPRNYSNRFRIEHKAPLYSHFLESMNGLPTIRAFGWMQPYREKNMRLLDNAQKPSYLLYCIQRWLTLVLDLVVAALTLLLFTCAVVLRNKVNPSLLGIALVNMMELGSNLKGIIIQWSTLETSLGAVTRIKEFTENAPVEIQPDEIVQPELAWPAQGILQFKNVSVQYEYVYTSPLLHFFHLAHQIRPVPRKNPYCEKSPSTLNTNNELGFAVEAEVARALSFKHSSVSPMLSRDRFSSMAKTLQRSLAHLCVRNSAASPKTHSSLPIPSNSTLTPWRYMTTTT